MTRPLVVHADDLGLSRSFNAGIRLTATRGFLTSTCLRVNGAAFDEAVHEVVPECPGIGLGVHLNIVEGRTTRPRVPRSSPLCDADGLYRVGFAELLRRQRDTALLGEIEEDFRDQIETAIACLPRLDHINSHQHSHAVPALFEIVCRLAIEYGIPFVRLPRESFYVAGSMASRASTWYAVNLVKTAVLNHLSRTNARTAERYGIGANDWFVGIGYTGYMDGATVLRGLAAVPKTKGIVELLLHPCWIVAERGERYLDAEVRDYVLHPARAREVATLLDSSVRDALRREGWERSCYGCLAAAAAETASRQAPVRAVPCTVPHEGRPAATEAVDAEQPARVRTLVVLDENAFGQAEYLRRLLAECAEIGVCGVAVVAGSSSRLRTGSLGRVFRGSQGRAVRALADRLGVPFRHVPAAWSDDLLAWFRALGPELILTTAPLPHPARWYDGGGRPDGARGSLAAAPDVLRVSREIRLDQPFSSASVHHSRRPDLETTLARRWVPIFPGDRGSRLERLTSVVGYEATVEAIRALRQGVAPVHLAPAHPEPRAPAGFQEKA